MIRYLVLVVALVATQLLLTVLRFTRTRKILRRLPSRTRFVDVQQLGSQVVRVSHAKPIVAIGVDCVAESLVLEAALRSYGLDPSLRLGVDPANPGSAHAWVEIDGVPVNDELDVEERWAAFDGEIPLR